MSTVTLLTAKVRRPLRDGNADFITDAEILEYLNEAQLDIAMRTLAIQAETTGTFSTYQVALPATYISFVSLRVGAEIEDAEWVDNETFDSWKRSGGTPPRSMARIFASNVEVYPTPSVGTAYTFRYARTPTALASGSDVPEVAEYWQVHNMVRYAQAHCKLKDGETGEFEAYMGMFNEGLPETKGPTTKFKPGPISIRFEPGPFDTYDAGHI